ncbi:hypothetical protein RRG08_029767 [Elysia crispata]|uniref:Uncharacterized protein n=1 Tax=Elysia crispata TaxID=231223 RepID=A0AAE1B5N5_9GAST|nr:hypothetical protein RRG08_029767 [Elysia crispata]
MGPQPFNCAHTGPGLSLRSPPRSPPEESAAQINTWSETVVVFQKYQIGWVCAPSAFSKSSVVFSSSPELKISQRRSTSEAKLKTGRLTRIFITLLGLEKLSNSLIPKLRTKTAPAQPTLLEASEM